MVRPDERPDLHDRPFDCVFCHQRISSPTADGDHADDCLRHLEAEFLPDPNDVRLSGGLIEGSATPTGDDDE